MTRKKILLVEDDQDIAQLATISLSEIGGFEVLHCPNGAAAIDSAPAYLPDLIILDFRMPGMNGDEVLLRLRHEPMLKDVPIIFMTASVMPAHVGRLRSLGAASVISKPFDPITLADQVRPFMC